MNGAEAHGWKRGAEPPPGRSVGLMGEAQVPWVTEGAEARVVTGVAQVDEGHASLGGRRPCVAGGGRGTNHRGEEGLGCWGYARVQAVGTEGLWIVGEREDTREGWRRPEGLRHGGRPVALPAGWRRCIFDYRGANIISQD
ncbi:hypothetical protein E2562_000124 [Oryza meyeriana var. granulata]|uniref:Uncharacterized protein n=1 Tax=Oryza meyeriana var. granulata TaxID=110450 RepID=A0A6G1DCA6_9ORYZ|nr:hypothetical protein E2562_000124 [Oryza meyeriana var. granulata]